MTATHEFKLVGGHPVLDFVNTVDDWTAPEPQDHLKGFADALDFAQAVGIVTTPEAQRLGRSNDASGELARLRKLRGVLERTLRSAIERRQPSPNDLTQLRDGLVEAARASELRRLPHAWLLTQQIPVKKGRGSALRLRILMAASALMLSPAMRQIKACPTCGWFFFDVSKNQSRVWCSMDMCGARAKSRRYYRRTKRNS